MLQNSKHPSPWGCLGAMPPESMGRGSPTPCLAPGWGLPFRDTAQPWLLSLSLLWSSLHPQECRLAFRYFLPSSQPRVTCKPAGTSVLLPCSMAQPQPTVTTVPFPCPLPPPQSLPDASWSPVAGLVCLGNGWWKKAASSVGFSIVSRSGKYLKCKENPKPQGRLRGNNTASRVSFF